MPNVIFKTEGLTKVYNTGDVPVHVLRGVDVGFFASEMTVLLGSISWARALSSSR